MSFPARPYLSNESLCVYFENNTIKIESITNFGNLNAYYDFAAFNGFKDLEYDDYYIQWMHNIKFQIDGEINFNGYIKIIASMDTKFGNNCSAHSIIKYTDKDNNFRHLSFLQTSSWKPNSFRLPRSPSTQSGRQIQHIRFLSNPLW